MLKFIYFKILVVLFTLFNLLNLLYANPVKAWNKASPSIVSVLPTWPGFKKPGFGAPPGTAPEGKSKKLFRS
tara:strand:- start:182 stop:397 length:216 start_codon:yes stop_codon:yes gene_type:complete